LLLKSDKLQRNYTGCVRKNGWISQGNKIGKASSNPNFIATIRFANTCSLFVEYNIIHMTSLAFDTDVEAFSEVIHHSRSYVAESPRFLLESLSSARPVYVVDVYKLPPSSGPKGRNRRAQDRVNVQAKEYHRNAR
jgi:hypothetical protein